jgi:hypothetical protein
MIVSVDGHAKALSSTPETLGTLIDELKRAAAKDNRIVMAVRVDGEDADAAAQNELAARPAGEFSSIELQTADARELCVATLAEAARHIPSIVEEGTRLADLIDAGEHATAIQRLSPLFEVWSTLVATVDKVSILLNLDLTQVGENGVTLAEVVVELSAFLQNLKSALDSSDMVAVRDCIKHEMPGVAEKLSGQLSALSASLSAS